MELSFTLSNRNVEYWSAGVRPMRTLDMPMSSFSGAESWRCGVSRAIYVFPSAFVVPPDHCLWRRKLWACCSSCVWCFQERRLQLHCGAAHIAYHVSPTGTAVCDTLITCHTSCCNMAAVWNGHVLCILAWWPGAHRVNSYPLLQETFQIITLSSCNKT